MQVWTSPAEIVTEFGIEQHLSDPDSLRTELRKIVTALHPDKNEGAFASDEDKTKFLKAQSAIDFLEIHSRSAMAMIPVSQLPAIVSAFAQALAVRTPGEIQSLQASFLVDAHTRISRKFLLPKIGSGVFAAVTGFLVAFPDKFANNPILGPILQERSTQIILFCLLFYSAIGFAFVWYKEKLAESRAEYLMSESALKHLFEILAGMGKLEGNRKRISSGQILDVVAELAGHSRYRQHQPLSAFIRSRLDLATIEKAASLQTQRLVERKVLSKVETPSIETWYEMHATA